MTAPFFSDETLAQFRAMDEANMPGTAQIVTTTGGGKNPDGSPADGVTTTGTDVDCRFLAGPGAAEVLADLRLTGEASAVLFVPLATGVTTTDAVVYNGDRYEIVGSNAGQSYATSLALALRLAK